MSKSLKKLIDINRLREFKNKLVVGAGSAYVQTGAVDQTIAGTKTFSKPIVGSVTGSSGSCTGNAATATTATSVPWNGVTGKPSSYTPAAHTQAASTITGLAKVATSGSYTDLANKPAIPTVNNATLTIQKNGTTVKTFTANASANVTANITVPTKVSELTNDSGFLTSHQSLSNYVTLNGAQTISGAKTFTGNVIGINKDNSAEDANSLYSTTAGSKLTYYTTSNGFTRLTNVPDAINTTLESRTIRRLSDSDWVVEQICHNTNGLYYRKGVNGTWGAWKTFAFTDSNISGNAATATTATTAQACTGNAATATKLQTARTINGTAFNGAANITTANWGTARNISITDGTNTSTAVSVNGSANVSLNLPATIKATFVGNITGNLTGNCSGSSGSCTGNSATATTATNSNAANQLQAFVNDDFTGGNHYVKAIRSSLGWSTHLWMCYNNGAKMADEVSVNYANSAGSANTANSATTATRATQDAAGNTITTTYATKAENNTKANNSEVVHKSGDETIAGTKTFSNGVLVTNANALMAQNGEYTLVLRNDGSNTYLLMSDKGGIPGTWSDARPLTISNSTGVCDINGNAATATTATTADHATNADSATRATNADSAANADHATNADSATRATSADRAAAANCVQSQSRDYHEIKFDWDSQVPGYVGLRVDAVDMGGIVTTNRLVSDIRAQWYAAYPDGAEAHNAMWGGRDITAAFNNGTVSANIANGTFRDIFPGDYITKAVTIYGNGTPGMTYTVNWVIADCDYWINKGDTATTTHHVAIVPQQPIFNANMNATNTTEGGYKGSVMYRSIIRASVTGGIVSAFGSDHILTFRDNISNSVDTSHVSSGIPQYMGTPDWGGEWVSVQCNLMSEKMVYGAPICAAGAMDNVMATRQMSAFRLSEKLINYNRNWWWLRDVVSSAFFAFVRGDGFADTGIASYVRGVRPFALLK